jgi:hypothetical protein
MGMDLYIEGTSDASGTIWFDPAAGMLILQESTTIQELTFAMTDPVPMTIPLTETISTSYSLVEK